MDGASFRDIANGLERDKIKTGGKRYKWHLSTIQDILQNEKYMGDALLQKLSRQISLKRPESRMTVQFRSIT
ncbi:recombinase family protein [uncultured Tyzzerella sp.]|uniref:recombinase family protein n=1 Tax=uncultured Tyzzerella sp. TaxID=2321398 RepID=UPI00294268FA|nr:recombinase family protein [uncultured Tyzzerella sp.]